MSDSDSASHDQFYQVLLGDFLGESEQILFGLNESLLRLDKWLRSSKEEPAQARIENLLNEMYRSIHSLKGLANMLGLEEIECFVGHVERLFDVARKGALVVKGGIVELMFEAIDRLASLIDAVKDLDVPAVNCDAVVDRISQVLEPLGGECPEDTIRSVERRLEHVEARVADVLGGMDAPASASGQAVQCAEVPTLQVPGDRRAAESSTPGTVCSAATCLRTTGRDVERVDSDEASRCESESRGIERFEDVVDEADLASRFMPIFIDETELGLDEVTAMLLALEGGGTTDKIKHLMVLSHRIKGSAASVGLNRAARLSHLMEDVLQELLDTGGTLSADMTDTMLKCVDELRHYVEGLKRGAIPIDGFAELAVELVRVRAKTLDSPPSVSATATTTGAGAAAALKSGGGEPRESTGDPRGVSASLPAREGEVVSGAADPENGDLEGCRISRQLRERVTALAPIGLPLYAGVAVFQPELPLAGLKAELLYEKLCGLGDVCYFDPAPGQFDRIEKLERIQFGLGTEGLEQEIRRVLRTAGIQQSVVELLFYGPGQPAAEHSPTGSAAVSEDESTGSEPRSRAESTKTEPRSMEWASGMSPASESASARASSADSPSQEQGRSACQTRATDVPRLPTETVRVDIDRLDQLMNLAGQLVVSKARFAQISDRMRNVFSNKQSVLSLRHLFATLAQVADLEDAAGEPHALKAELTKLGAQARQIQIQLEPMQHELKSFHQMHTSINELEEAVHQLERVADEIQKNVMDTRMVPIGPLFTRFHRVIRDITRSSGKSIQLVLRGEKTELDKRMIDELGDPLIHMVRNSADHGIETPEARARAGKATNGTIRLDACHRGNSIVIQISDDGKGLNPDDILRKALDKGVISPADAERMTTHQVYQLIWQPGFSTAERITDMSGRGVGMDIVKSKVESLNGTVELESTPGAGTTITIKLPLTLAILPSLMVEIEGDVFALPMESVSEIIRVRANEVSTIQGKEAAQVRGRIVSIVHLDDVFQWSGKEKNHASCPVANLTVVVVNEGDEEIGVVVDRVIGEEDVVIKSMSENYKNVPGVAGASVLGDGRVSLILDLAAVIALSSRPFSSAMI